MRIVVGCLVAMLAGVASAQHSDIAVYQSAAGQVTLHSTESANQPESRYFQRDFDFWGPPFGVYAGDDPGFQMSGLNPPAGYSALPSGMNLGMSVLPIHVPGAPAGNLLFWDGVGPEVTIARLPQNHVFFLEDAAMAEISFQGGTERFEGLVAGVTDGDGGLHEHLTFAVENGGAEPEAGFYMMGWQLHGAGLEDSGLTIVALSAPTIPSAIEQQFRSWLEAQADSITVAGDFDDNGEYELDDIDALVAAIASGAHDPVFDLTGDGLTNAGDLDLWRELAGRVLNDSQGPVLVGDANLDGVVDGQDFIAWNNNKFTALASWSGGDFTADGLVDGQDFVAWNNFKFQTADGTTVVVPEPGFDTLAWMTVASCLLSIYRRHF